MLALDYQQWLIYHQIQQNQKNNWSAPGLMDIVVRNRHSEPSSNHWHGCFYFT